MPNMDGFELTRKLREQILPYPSGGLQPTHRLTNVKRVKLRHELMFVQTVDPGCTETHLSQLHQVAHIAPQYRHLESKP